jgi:hypothetical protein
VVTTNSLDIVLDHPLQNFFVLVSFGDEVSDVNEDVLKGVVGYL